ncbi:MAG TPA: 3-oxoacyl-[acyl-carrier-protein] synthase III C-terminal domain-containing protein [Candidatus Acidoferrales bacterium]|nr:3-oxoacyl-[acyl-carrier-protein] synthase III C-terminal domain-containing protein [Candidatus Acidoferrales bacterium]
MFIVGIGTATPPNRYSQQECWTTLKASARFREFTPRSQAILKKVLTGDNGIVTRHLALENLEQAFEITPDVLHARFIEHAPRLATQAGERALADAKIDANEIDALLISTCTGYLCPGLTSYASERLGLRPDVLALDLVGQGCGAAIPNLQTARSLVAAGDCQRVLSICVEVCSAAFYLDDDAGVLISACLFGDGAGAAVLSASANGGRRVRWKTGGSLLKPDDRDQLRFEQKNGLLRNILTPGVPSLAAGHVGAVLEDTLTRSKIDRSQIKGWILHPGGRDVLLALREKIRLSSHDVRWSEGVLREHGNMSSPSVLFVLQAALADHAPGGLWWMTAFGAGFSCHGALLEVE